MTPKLKSKVLKERARSTAVRPGWRRFTTYMQHETIDFLKTEAARRKIWLTDLIAEAIDGYRRSQNN